MTTVINGGAVLSHFSGLWIQSWLLSTAAVLDPLSRYTRASFRPKHLNEKLVYEADEGSGFAHNFSMVSSRTFAPSEKHQKVEGLVSTCKLVQLGS